MNFLDRLGLMGAVLLVLEQQQTHAGALPSGTTAHGAAGAAMPCSLTLIGRWPTGSRYRSPTARLSCASAACRWLRLYAGHLTPRLAGTGATRAWARLPSPSPRAGRNGCARDTSSHAGVAENRGLNPACAADASASASPAAAPDVLDAAAEQTHYNGPPREGRP
jgi:hypothetical protein